jgi:hypothetical protein
VRRRSSSRTRVGKRDCWAAHVFEEAGAERLRTLKAVSTHSFGVVEASYLARALGRLPSRLFFPAVEGGDSRVGKRLTPPVVAVVALLVQRSSLMMSPITPIRGEK